jgi:hypothetical protein
MRSVVVDVLGKIIALEWGTVSLERLRDRSHVGCRQLRPA